MEQALLQGVREGRSCTSPFMFLNVSDNPAALRQCAATHALQFSDIAVSLGPLAARDSNGRIRLAYVSPDFGQHPVSYLIADLIEQHDRSRFEVIGVSLARGGNDPWRQRLVDGFDRFFDMRAESDESVVRRLRELRVDIAVDLAGYTTSSRPTVFASRAAPIQVNYLGFPGTMGAGFMDYILADRFVIPEAQQPHYTEKVVYLPDSFQSAAHRQIGERTPTRRELRLPDKGFVFCCFNNTYKIHPDLFDIWMRLLAQVEGSVLWVSRSNELVEQNLRREAQSRGVDPDRLVFAPRAPFEEYLARYRQADVFLDTLPFNAGTTASDALWAGLPVLTCSGRSFASRMAGSLLHAAGLPELVTDSLEEYEALALRLAQDPALLGSIRDKLGSNRATAPLFDVDRFRRHIEAAYRRMFDTDQRGEPPSAFVVNPEEESGDPAIAGAATARSSPIPVVVARASPEVGGQEEPPTEKKKLLHVGCGPASPEKLPAIFRSHGWLEVRLDIDPDCKPDIVSSMTDMSGVGTASCDAIFSSHNLEHLYPHEVPMALREFHRALAPEGFALVTVPDLQRVAELVSQDKLEDTAYVSPAGPISPLDMLFGHRASLARGNLFMAHRTGFTAKALAGALRRAGFVQVGVKRDGRFGLSAIAYLKARSEQELAAMEQALEATKS
jgi:glycosyltransferase involved in cell wall biosynthesis